MWKKVEIVSDWKMENARHVETCVAAVQRASFYAGPGSRYFFVVINESHHDCDEESNPDQARHPSGCPWGGPTEGL